MSMDRRTALQWGGALATAGLLAPNLRLIAAPAPKSEAKSENRWGILVDLDRCSKDCSACTTACRTENNVPLFNDPKRDIHWIRKVEIHDPSGRAPDRSVPVLCQQCQNPPCVHVCPTEASFVRKDGLVLIDEHRCIGCRYCIIACPFKARSLVYWETRFPEGGNPDVPMRGKGVVEKCTFCVHRIDRGEIPACVQACQAEAKGAMTFGNLNDPDSEIAKKLKEAGGETLRSDLGLDPNVYYQGL